MSTLQIQIADITKLDVDAIVNAANSGLWAGGGVCGAIFAAAGHRELEAACTAIGGCPTGGAVITPGFHLPAKYIIHAVGPRWQGGHSGEEAQLAGAYRSSLQVAMDNGCHTVAFPLISSGIFGYPKEAAWRVAIDAIRSFQNEHPDYRLEVTIAVLGEGMQAMGQRILEAR